MADVLRLIPLSDRCNVLAIARLRDRLGRRDEPRQEYLRFLDHWKRADANLPEVVEARRRVS